MRKWIKIAAWVATVPVAGFLLWYFTAVMSIFAKLLGGDLRDFELEMTKLVAPIAFGFMLIAWAAKAVFLRFRQQIPALVCDELRAMGMAVVMGMLYLAVHAMGPAWLYGPVTMLAGLWLFVGEWREVHPWRRVIRLAALTFVTFMVIHYPIFHQ